MRPFNKSSLLLTLTIASLTCAQSQSNTFNSDFSLSSSQIAFLNLSAPAVAAVNAAVQFERTNWATGSVLDDPFYTDLTSACGACDSPTGSLLKLEEVVDTSAYTLAPALALSRFVYQSKTLNGSLVPVSAFILWPFLPKDGGDAVPMVTWGHGSSGFLPECAPSHIRNLWYHFSAPFALALAGYAVVASDFAGLGVPYYPDGSPILHEYAASPAAGNDLLYAAQAAHAAFPDKLTEEFVVMGHSQGGGAAWGAAQQQLDAKVPGYLGCVASSPITDVVDQARKTSPLGLLLSITGLRSILPSLDLSEVLTSAGQAFTTLVEEVQGCQSMFGSLLGGILIQDPTTALVKTDFFYFSYADEFQNLTSVGSREFQGPMLVLQGTNDLNVPEPFTTQAVKETCEVVQDQALHYAKVESASHTSVLYATQQVWLAWIDEQFAARSSGSGSNSHSRRCIKRGDHNDQGHGKCSFETIGSKAPRPLEDYQTGINYFIEYALYPYETVA